MSARAFGSDTSRSERRVIDRAYAAHVREIDADTPARFNADPRHLHEAAGCAGRLAVFAVRLDTFEAEKETAVFYVGSNDPAELTDIRRAMLASFANLPISGEYIHREAYDVAAKYGKDTFLIIKLAGAGRMPAVFAFKANRAAGLIGVRGGGRLGRRCAFSTPPTFTSIPRFGLRPLEIPSARGGCMGRRGWRSRALSTPRLRRTWRRCSLQATSSTTGSGT